jgi:hypothetical protein
MAGVFIAPRGRQVAVDTVSFFTELYTADCIPVHTVLVR